MEALLQIEFNPTTLAVVGGVLASIVTSVVKKSTWSKGLKIGLPVLLALLIGVADAALRGQLTSSDIIGSAIFALGAAQTFYNVNFLVSRAEGRVKPQELPVNATP